MPTSGPWNGATMRLMINKAGVKSHRDQAKHILAFCLTALFFHLSFVPNVRSGNVEKVGDVINNVSDTLIYVVPTFAFGMTLGARDGPGTLQFGESVGVAMGITAALKYTIRERRPNGQKQSFPSGHMAITVTSAEFMRKRYGWQYGLPAYLISAYVGYDRIRVDEHYYWDVAAGAAISFTSAYLITKPYKGWALQPEVESKYLGVRISRSF